MTCHDPIVCTISVAGDARIGFCWRKSKKRAFQVQNGPLNPKTRAFPRRSRRITRALPLHSPCNPSAFAGHEKRDFHAEHDRGFARKPMFANELRTTWRTNHDFGRVLPWRSEIRVGDRAGFATSDCETGNGRRSTGRAKNCAASIMHSIFMHFRARNNAPNASATVLPVRLRESARLTLLVRLSINVR